jgi:creatinine amidohydrolase
MKVLSHLAYPEVEALVRRGAIALWPMGSTEAHGPHLPLGTDQIIAEEASRRASGEVERRFGVESVLLPTLTVTVTEFAAPFSGTLSIPKDAALAYVREGVLAAAAIGFRAVCLVNAHLEPAHRFVLRDAVDAARARTSVPIALADPADRRWAKTLTEEFASGACHAGQYETSLVLAAAPEVVKTEIMHALEAKEIDLVGGMKAGAKNFREMGAERAYFGAPARATKDEGEATYRRLVEIVSTVIAEAMEAEAKRDP